MGDDNTPRIAKIVFVGSSGVGKTSIIQRAFDDTFTENTQPTVGSGFAKGTITANGRRITFEIWDTAGQEMYQSLTPMFFKDACAAVLVYDITQAESLTALDSYISIIKEKALMNVGLVFVGNKVDLEETKERKVSYKEGEDYANARNALFFVEASAATGYGVDVLFKSLATSTELPFIDQNQPVVTLAEPQTAEKKGCC